MRFPDPVHGFFGCRSAHGKIQGTMPDAQFYHLFHFPIPDFPRLTHFGHTRAMRSSPSLPELHRHFGFEFKYIQEGKSRFHIHPDMAPVQITPGDLLVTHPDFAHRFDTGGEPLTFLWFGVQTGRRIARARRSDLRPADPMEITYAEQSDRDLEDMGSRIPPGNFLILHRMWEVEPLLLGIRAEIDGGRKYARQMVHLKLLEIFTLLLRRLDEVGTPPPAPDLTQVAAWMAENLDRPLRLEALARRAGLSTAHFSREFHRAFGTSPVAYANDLRLDAAKKRLQAGEKVVHVAEALGFRDAFYFSAFFKAKTGVPPSRFSVG